MQFKRKVLCRMVNENNGIKQVLLTCDEYLDHYSQPEEWLVNLNEDIFKEGDEWEITMRRLGTKSK